MDLPDGDDGGHGGGNPFLPLILAALTLAAVFVGYLMGMIR